MCTAKNTSGVYGGMSELSNVQRRGARPPLAPAELKKDLDKNKFKNSRFIDVFTLYLDLIKSSCINRGLADIQKF